MPLPTRRLLAPLVAALTLAVAASASHAQYGRQEVGSMTDRPTTAPYKPDQVGVDEKLGNPLPLDAVFKDETGKTGRLGDYFGKGRPVIVQFVYYECPMLCGLTSRGMVEALQNIKLDQGREFDVVSISIDPGEIPALARRKKESYMDELGKPGDAVGWHFLTGEPDPIKAAAAAAGFKYVYVDKLGEWAHPAVLVIASPDGKVMRYLYGTSYNPQTLRLSLVEAADGRIGSTIDHILLTCFRFDPTVGKYTWAAVTALKVTAGVTAGVLGMAMVPLWLRSRRSGGAAI